MEFNQNLQFLMDKNKTSAYKLAKALTVHQTTIRNWLDGKSAPNSIMIEKICNYFGVSANSLLGKTNDLSLQENEENTMYILGSGGTRDKIILSDENMKKVEKLLKEAKNKKSKKEGPNGPTSEEIEIDNLLLDKFKQLSPEKKILLSLRLDELINQDKK